jgi:uncharacterized membrane protein YhfC
MLIAAFVTEIMVMLGAPVLLGLWLRRKWGLPWTLFLIGSMTFVASQVVHIPLNAGLTALFRQDWLPAVLVPQPSSPWILPFNAVVLGLTAGLCEELARYFVLRFWLKEARSWRHAVVFGAGHGGLESWFAGLLVVLTIASMAVMRNQDPVALGIPPEMAEQAAREITGFWTTSAYIPLLAAAERMMSIVAHLALSVLVMQSFLRERLWPLFVAIAWHSLFNAVAVFVLGTWGAVAVEAALAFLTLINALIIWATWRASTE